MCNGLAYLGYERHENAALLIRDFGDLIKGSGKSAQGQYYDQK